MLELLLPALLLFPDGPAKAGPSFAGTWDTTYGRMTLTQ